MMPGLLILLLLVAIVTLVYAIGRRRRQQREATAPPPPPEARRLARRRRLPPLAVSPELDGRLADIEIDGDRRQYLYYRPATASGGTPPPLLLVCHGGLGNPVNCARASRINPAAERYGFAAVYPSALGLWADGRETTGRGSADITFVVDLCQRLCRTEGLDHRRVYAVGASNGGMFVLRLALEVPELFAGFAATMAAMPAQLARDAIPGRPAPLMMVNGLRDPMIPWQGGTVGGRPGAGGSILAVEDSVAFWRQRNRCLPARISQFASAARSGAAAAELADFPPAAGGAPLRFLKLFWHRHEWPNHVVLRRAAADGTVIDATVFDLVWQFLSPDSLTEGGNRGDARPSADAVVSGS
ncbi:MAG: alpha/beta fold hydrolase [Rhodospirillales bacterium]|jgi:polyhydroxybutyrate depolymerase|nr:alpha/beta fold hydrolase [Rhodospirillales bacterium]